MTRYTEIHNHSVNAVFNPSHKHSNIVFPEKKSFLLWRRDHEKNQKNKNTKIISHWNKQLPCHESNCFHWADKPQFNPLELDFRLFYKPCRELLWNIYEDRAYIFKACMYCNNKKNDSGNSKQIKMWTISVAWLVIAIELAYRSYSNCIN